MYVGQGFTDCGFLIWFLYLRLIEILRWQKRVANVLARYGKKAFMASARHNLAAIVLVIC